MHVNTSCVMWLGHQSAWVRPCLVLPIWSRNLNIQLSVQNHECRVLKANTPRSRCLSNDSRVSQLVDSPPPVAASSMASLNPIKQPATKAKLTQKLASENDNTQHFSSRVAETLAPRRLWLDVVPAAPTSSGDPHPTRQWPEYRNPNGNRSQIRDPLKETQSTWPDSKPADPSKLDLLLPDPTRLRKLCPGRRKVDTSSVSCGPIPSLQLNKRSTINRPFRRRRLANFYDGVEEAPFACPFYIHQPELHEDCQHYILKRIKDVRQHISRRHKDSSRRDWDCSGQAMLTVSPQQWERITQQAIDPSSKTESLKEQWIRIWEILFPGSSPPRSVSLSNKTPPGDTAQTLHRLRRFWLSKRDEIVKQTMQQARSSLENQPDRNFFDHFVDCFLGQFGQSEADMAGPSSVETTQVSTPHQAPFQLDSVRAMATSMAAEGPSIRRRKREDNSPQPVYYDAFSAEYEDEWEDTPFTHMHWASDQYMPLFRSPQSNTVSLTNTTASRPSHSSAFSVLPQYHGAVYFDEQGPWTPFETNLAQTSFPTTEEYRDGAFHGNFQQPSNRNTWPMHAAASMGWHWNGGYPAGTSGQQ